MEDSLGQHISDYYGEMHKNRLSQDGSILSTESWKEKKTHGKALHDRVTKELKEHQGCRMTGHIELQRVPGNFHIGFHAYGDIVASLEQSGVSFDNSFHVHHISFGEKANYNRMRKHFPNTGVSHPLDGFYRRPQYMEGKDNKKPKH